MPLPNENAPLSVTPGSIRFNTDSMKLEYYRGGPVGFGTTTQTGEWVNITTDSPDIQTGGARGLFGGGYTPATTNTIDYVTITTTGNAIDFGDLTYSAGILKGGASSITRGLFQGGRFAINTINFITISSIGNAQDFGDLTVGREDPAGVSNSTRGVFMGGGQHPGASPLLDFVNTIDYVTIASTGNANDFGDITIARRHQGECASSTRGICVGGFGYSNNLNVIDFISISTLGNAADFGDLTQLSYGTSGSSNSVRGIIAIGNGNGSNSNAIEYITIATLGNA